MPTNTFHAARAGSASVRRGNTFADQEILFSWGDSLRPAE
jgi:hypothetical protein